MIFGVKIKHIRHCAFRGSYKNPVLICNAGVMVEENIFELAEPKIPGSNRDALGCVGDKGIVIDRLRNNSCLRQDRFSGEVGVPVNDGPAKFQGV